MGKIKTITIDRFDGGEAFDPRDKNFSEYYHSKHFDNFSYKHKLKPHPELTQTTYEGGLTNQGIFRLISKENVLWGIGQRASDSKTSLFYWDASNGYWAVPEGTNVATTDNVSKDVFVLYKNYAYFFDLDAGYLQRSNLSTFANDITEDYYDGFLGATTYLAQPVHFKIDDILYFFVGSSVFGFNDGSWEESGTALIAFPDNSYISCGCEYGDFLAVACNNINAKRSTIYFWDRDSSLTTVNRRFDFDGRYIYHIATLGGRLYAIMSDNVRISIKVFNGAEFEEVTYLLATRSSAGEPTNGIEKYNFNYDNKLYFPMDFEAPGESNDYNERLGIWSLNDIGRLSLEYIVGGATSYKGMAVHKNDFYVAYNNSDVAKGGIAYSTTTPSIYESLFIRGGGEEMYKTKKLLSVGVQTEALPASGQVVLKYRTSENSAWTTIFTNTTDDSEYHDAVNIESTGATLPEFREIQFRLESTGGAITTAINIKYEVKDDELN